MSQNGWEWVQKVPKNIFSHFLSNYVFLWIFGDFFRFFGPFLTILDFWGAKWPKMAKNWSKKTQKIFSLIFYQIIHFFEFLVIFSDFLDHFLIFGPKMTQNGSKMTSTFPQKNFWKGGSANFFAFRMYAQHCVDNNLISET